MQTEIPYCHQFDSINSVNAWNSTGSWNWWQLQLLVLWPHHLMFNMPFWYKEVLLYLPHLVWQEYCILASKQAMTQRASFWYEANNNSCCIYSKPHVLINFEIWNCFWFANVATNHHTNVAAAGQVGMGGLPLLLLPAVVIPVLKIQCVSSTLFIT